MIWNSWSLTKKITIGSVMFIILYILTIPIRDYSFLDVEKVTIFMHTLIIFVALVVYSILIVIIDFVVRILMKKFSKS